ncbi:hypothetical protein BJ138DRAFT_1107587, partial [Hygrophoropsis aurantiaca]
MNSDSDIAVPRQQLYHMQLLTRKYKENLPSMSQQTLAYCQMRIRSAIDKITGESSWGAPAPPIAVLHIYQVHLVTEADVVARVVMQAMEWRDPVLVPNYLQAFCKVVDSWRNRSFAWHSIAERAEAAADAAVPDLQAHAAYLKELFSDMATVRIDHDWDAETVTDPPILSEAWEGHESVDYVSRRTQAYFESEQEKMTWFEWPASWAEMCIPSSRQVAFSSLATKLQLEYDEVLQAELQTREQLSQMAAQMIVMGRFLEANQEALERERDAGHLRDDLPQIGSGAVAAAADS